MPALPPMSRFLCGTYTVKFHARPGGGSFNATLPRSSTTGTWRRQANGTAVSELTVNTCDFVRIDELQEWAHYATFQRTGYAAPTKTGPIVGITENDTGQDTATILIADPSAWWDEIGLQRYASSGALSSSTGAADYITGGQLDSGQVFADLVAMSEQINPTGLGIRVDPTGNAMTARFMRSDGKSIGSYIKTVTEHSVDWTVTGNQLRAGSYVGLVSGGSIPLGSWSAPPVIITSGFDLATRVENIGEYAATAINTDAESFYGRHELFLTDTELADAASAQRLVDSTLRRTQAPPVDVSATTATLTADTPFGFNEAICGAVFATETGSRARPGVVARRLNSLEVDFVAGAETAVRPTLEPVGAT